MADRLKIAFLMQESRMGGIEYNSVHLAEKMDCDKFEIVFLCPPNGKLPELLLQKKLRLIVYDRPRLFSTSIRFGKGHIFNPVSTFYNFLCCFAIAPGLAGHIKRERFKVVFTKGILANFYGALAARLAGVSAVWDMQEIVSKNKAFGLIAGILDFWADYFTAGIIVSAAPIRNQFSARVKQKTAVIPNGINTALYHPAINPGKVRNEWGIKSGEILIAHIARFTYWKGQKDFLNACGALAEKIPHARFVLVGAPVFENDEYEKEIRELAKSLGLGDRVLFPGFRDDLRDVMAAVDIFVHSSTEPEGCPITLLIAMSMAKPVVATEIDGNTEIIQGNTEALLVPPRRPEKIAEAVLRIIHESGLKESLGENARKRILKRYDVMLYAKECENFFLKLGAVNE